MEQQFQFYFNFLEDILEDINQYEENALRILLNKKITLNEARIIDVISDLKEEQNNMSSQIALRMKTTRSAVSIALKNMEKKHFVFRATDPEDRRHVFVELTKQGYEILTHYQNIHSDIVSKAFKSLDEKEIKELTLLTTSLRNHVKSLVE